MVRGNLAETNPIRGYQMRIIRNGSHYDVAIQHRHATQDTRIGTDRYRRCERARGFNVVADISLIVVRCQYTHPGEVVATYSAYSFRRLNSPDWVL